MKKIIVILFSILFVSCGVQTPQQTPSIMVVASPDTIKIVLEKNHTFNDLDWRSVGDGYDLWLTTRDAYGRVKYERVYSETHRTFNGVVVIKETY